MSKVEFLEKSRYEISQKIRISYRGSLADEVSAIDCKASREDIFHQIVLSNFVNIFCYWESTANLVIGRIDDIGLYFPDW